MDSLALVGKHKHMLKMELHLTDSRYSTVFYLLALTFNTNLTLPVPSFFIRNVDTLTHNLKMYIYAKKTSQVWRYFIP